MGGGRIWVMGGEGGGKPEYPEKLSSLGQISPALIIGLSRELSLLPPPPFHPHPRSLFTFVSLA